MSDDERGCGRCGTTQSADGDWYNVCGPCYESLIANEQAEAVIAERDRLANLVAALEAERETQTPCYCCRERGSGCDAFCICSMRGEPLPTRETHPDQIAQLSAELQQVIAERDALRVRLKEMDRALPSAKDVLGILSTQESASDE